MTPDDRPLRLFVAIDLPDEVREAVRRLQDDLRRRDLPRLRWVRPEGMHLTLKFLGETQPQRLPAVEAALADATRDAPALRLSLGRPGTFGSRRGPRVLWLDVGGHVEQVRRLQRAVDEALAAAGFPPDEREFSPHLTLARVPQPPRPGLAEALARALETAEPPRAEFEAQEVLLMRSMLRPDGAVYERVAAYPLRTRSAVE